MSDLDRHTERAKREGITRDLAKLKNYYDAYGIPKPPKDPKRTKN